MTFKDYFEHYISVPEVFIFLLISFVLVIFIHLILLLIAKIQASSFCRKDQIRAELDFYTNYSEQFYELLFASTSILFFISIYFWIDLDYFQMDTEMMKIWTKYQDFLLLGFIIISALFDRFIDHIVVPLREIDKEKKSTLRMMAMIYMMIVFLYIKFIYEDNNYDTILFYFVTLVIGRFVYFDASFKEFCQIIKKMVFSLPILLLELLSTALLALYGFTSGYLLRSNGVVGSLFIAHFFVIAEIFILARTKVFSRIIKRKRKKPATNKEAA